MSQTLEGLKVLELGSLIAGPFAGRLMAEFGADVIKVEPPGKGDPLRDWRHIYKDQSLWWRLQARNKKSLTIDLKKKEGQEIIQSLVKECDIIIENFRPGTLEKWNIGYDQLSAINPGIIMVRVSGYGQTGPYRDKTGFGSVGESMGGIRHLTGYPDRAPTRAGISLGDSLAAMYAVIGALMAVYHRDVKGTGEGQIVDVALYEAVFSLMESMLPEYDKFGVVRQRTGSSLPGIAPSNTYQCKDGKYIVIGGNGDAIFRRLMCAIGDRELAEDERFTSNKGRAAHADFLDSRIEDWTKTVNLETAIQTLDDAKVPAGAIYSIEDIVKDPQYLAREMIQQFDLGNDDALKIPGVVPKMSRTPGGTNWLGPDLGEHTGQILKDLLAFDEERIAKLKNEGII
ncbi:CaiB/BaiF CoA transferase family protein [Virgibacillus oceani]|uniref:CoA transferase n=1 Tax=Virgibacillus oceani TaxID=1479511 RepID=A0A917HKY1_9BACI|nr:CaiB/BaiF CoA-transferase family protein [Virgibacillus oceani]GGG82865.1 CoA transferase [Virgibacillus oceani]